MCRCKLENQEKTDNYRVRYYRGLIFQPIRIEIALFCRFDWLNYETLPRKYRILLGTRTIKKQGRKGDPELACVVIKMPSLDLRFKCLNLDSKENCSSCFRVYSK